MLRILLRFLLLASLLAPVAGCAPGAPHGDHRPPAGHAHHDFSDAERWAKHFEDPERDAWQRPQAVLERLGLEGNERVADIGSGTGYFSVRLARALPGGHVYGIDIEPSMVDYLNRRAADEGLANLESRLGRADDPLLPEAVDLVLVVDTYHHLSERSAYFRRLAASLLPGGRIAIVDFKPGDLPVGPPDTMKVRAEEILQEMEAAGYRLALEDRDLLPYQDLLVFVLADR